MKKPKFRAPKMNIKKGRKSKKNEVPGTLEYTGDKSGLPTKIEVFDYTADYYEYKESNSIEDAFDKRNTKHISWININGLHNTEEIEKLGEHYNIHPLILEDIVDTAQRPKIDEYANYLFIVFKMMYHREDGEFINEHMSLIMGEDYVLTFQESDGDVFDGLRSRIANSKGRIRNNGADYLMFAILDAVVDNYFTVMETISDKVETLEDLLFAQEDTKDITQDIQDLKREILKIRRATLPLREVVNRIEKIDSPLIEEKTSTFLRDLYDHIIQVNESVDIYREMIWGLMDMYMTTISNKMNEVMKVLTIMASIFIPLTFMAGIYGMNFEYIPELQFKYGYFYLWGAMLIVFFGLLWYFKRKKWL
ncbi:magnesium/cobalt transporter CorA [Croceibacter atlanticus]|jgi:magnesium transporter|uniref:Magnesium transport protein CorA n=1 Tax=Croceibacter atlanticus (strain ATCC BAA-628 / JCM 21780 / CIP 108009 / IAM 15332 / KCTC 12090 / HTCC2559) TaxID=216432 RepID=A3U9J6_CROAH|nr:magnesium/cobalt transporter CorA [Croceibacter atlanticus]EAP86482.1 Magnesium and cobalt transport protein [Croceibacter atlanticus HTCC2559]WSP34158.1 magnesium/cobalt transporter CorA [Croceibacter atlanticus]|tara:strand:+ start:43515 stop:44606 length:1092 start_codon:yes stop_codon:yes gene_type:complete